MVVDAESAVSKFTPIPRRGQRPNVQLLLSLGVFKQRPTCTINNMATGVHRDVSERKRVK